MKNRHAPLIRTQICASADLVDGGKGVRFELDYQGARTPAFVIRYGGGIHAYLNRCAHVAVELDWQPGEFFDDSRIYLICATHGARYAPATGACLCGRCNGRSLTPLHVEESSGQIYLLEEITTVRLNEWMNRCKS